MAPTLPVDVVVLERLLSWQPAAHGTPACGLGALGAHRGEAHAGRGGISLHSQTQENMKPREAQFIRVPTCWRVFLSR